MLDIFDEVQTVKVDTGPQTLLLILDSLDKCHRTQMRIHFLNHLNKLTCMFVSTLRLGLQGTYLIGQLSQCQLVNLIPLVSLLAEHVLSLLLPIKEFFQVRVLTFVSQSELEKDQFDNFGEDLPLQTDALLVGIKLEWLHSERAQVQILGKVVGINPVMQNLAIRRHF